MGYNINISDNKTVDFIKELEEKDNKIKLFKFLGLLPSLIILVFVVYKLFEPIDTKEEIQNYLYITHENVNLRDQPSKENSNIVSKSEKGDKFRFISKKEKNWYQIATSKNDTLYVHEDLGVIFKESVDLETVRRFDDDPNMRYILIGITFLLLIIWNYLLYQEDKKRKSIFVNYELDETLVFLQKEMISAFYNFNSANKKWQIINKKRNHDVKYTAGAKVTVDRIEIKDTSSHQLPTSFFHTNIKIPYIELKDLKLFFLPDRLLIKRKKLFKAIHYCNIDISLLPVNFREYESVPLDAVVVDHTYQYINKNGGPDRRFAHNPRVPICDYTQYHFTSKDGTSLIFMPSKTNAMDKFVACIKMIGEIQKSNQQQTPISEENHAKVDVPQEFNTNIAIAYQKFSLPQFDDLFQEAAQIVVDSQQGSVTFIQRKLKLGYNRAGKLIEELEDAGIISSSEGSKARNVLIKNREELYQLLSQLESIEIDNKGEDAFGENKNLVISTSDDGNSENLEQVLEELENLIGLEDVKQALKSLMNFIQISKAREQSGLKSSALSYHIVFTGNPGTGKTTVARIIAKIYKHLGILEKGHLIETDRSGLVAEYTGQTAVKVNNTVDKAINGVLFIDEAYSLVGENKDDFGKEAVATLIKRMEDDRDKLVLILAGYNNEMNNFIDTNPGFKSRINRYINFPDYTPKEMFEIFESKCNKLDYILTDDAKIKLKSIFENAYSTRDKSFGNGRFVRNVFEKTMENQANRIAKKQNLSKEILVTIVEEDIVGFSS